MAFRESDPKTIFCNLGPPQTFAENTRLGPRGTDISDAHGEVCAVVREVHVDVPEILT